MTQAGGLRLSTEEVAAVLALPASLLGDCLAAPPPSLGRLLGAGGALLARSLPLDPATGMVPLGTARALATLQSQAPNPDG